jgi:hypothetical protein
MPLNTWRRGEEGGGEVCQALAETIPEPELREGFQLICDRDGAHAQALTARLLELWLEPQALPEALSCP